jgi:hypothetical protein
VVAIQTTDGNISELTLGVQAAPQTATATATLTVAQITGGLLVADPSGSAASYTLPTTVATEAVVTNAKVDSTFELTSLTWVLPVALLRLSLVRVGRLLVRLRSPLRLQPAFWLVGLAPVLGHFIALLNQMRPSGRVFERILKCLIPNLLV